MVVKAKELYLRAITVDPNYALAYFNLANLLDADWKTTGEAVRCYQMAIDVNPDYADAHYNLALCLQNRGELMEAAKHWLHYLRLDQGSSWSVVAKRKLDDIVSLITIKGGRDD
jgi:tetratricopeptide (TPR) repeat protein